MRDGVLKLLNLEMQTHPFSVLRAAALTNWVDTGGYGAVMAGNYPRRSDDDQARLHDDMSTTARHYKASLDQSVDHLISGIRHGHGGIGYSLRQAGTNG